MASRIFDITLTCGCMISLDGGGGTIPCEGDSIFDYSGNNNPPSQEAKDKHDNAWEKYRKSDAFKKHEEEIELRNS